MHRDCSTLTWIPVEFVLVPDHIISPQKPRAVLALCLQLDPLKKNSHILAVLRTHVMHIA